MNCPICLNPGSLHNTAQIGKFERKVFSCTLDRILFSDTGEIVMTDFNARPDINGLKERLRNGFDFDDSNQISEFSQIVVLLFQYIDRLEKQLQEKDTILKLLRRVELAVEKETERMLNKETTDIKEVNDE